VNLTNDGWFSTSDAGRRQHLQLARWRCLETGTPMLRSANTGISAVIDERGRLLAKGVDGTAQDTNIDGVLSYSLQFSTIPTFFARHGDVVRWPVLAGAVGTVTGALFLSLRHRRRDVQGVERDRME
jgi:apolipoprotein N-acyltransferase